MRTDRFGARRRRPFGALWSSALAIAVLAAGGLNPLAAQWAGTGKTPPPTKEAIAQGNVKAVLFNWMWYLGMLRQPEEVDYVTMPDLWKSNGTIRVQGQACKLKNYRLSINFQVSGMRANYSCTLPNGQAYQGIEVVSGEFAWDEDVVGAGLEPGRGTATPNPGARDERLIRLWASHWGAPKSAVAAGEKTKVAMEGGKPVITFPLPDVKDATAKATLNSENQAERVEVHQGTVVTEFTYENYGDWNPPDDKVLGYTPKHIVEKRDGVMIRDINVIETEVGNLYIVMPVPPSVRNAAGRRP